jgi:hypothetical protein
LRLRKSSLLVALLATAGAALTAAAAAPAQPIDKLITAPDVPPREECTMPESTQALIAYGDDNSYFLAPGGSFEGDNAHWHLAAGAQLTQAAGEDGTESGVLELPSGGQAVSPVLCVTSDFPHARVFARSVTGGDEIDFGVSYYARHGWSKFTQTGHIRVEDKMWALSDPLGLHPDKKSGWQQVRLAFYGGGTGNVFQLDNLWLDPRGSR